MKKVQYVGYVISESGIEFSDELKVKALQFELPKSYKLLKQFVGVVERFHRHVRSFTEIARPLHTMLQGYSQRKNRHQVIQWDKAQEDAFYALQKAVSNAQKLFFVRDDWEIHLETDASDYGIGAYLYQKGSNEEEEPIAFISKALIKEQVRWSVPEKEQYAIFYALTKLEHLLRDTFFVLHTDHENLTRLNFGNSNKILRWKLFIQDFDFDIEWIKGELNPTADGFSRLVQKPELEEGETHTLRLFPTFSIPEENYRMISQVHNSIIGHHGIERTLKKLIDTGHNWLYMREHVKAFIKRCPLCQTMSVLKAPIHTHPFTVGTYEPMERVAVDTIGPFPEDELGNTYIIVLVCCFSRFCLLTPAKDATAMSAARAVLQFAGIFGLMSQLLSDMGTQYVNKIIDELIHFTGVEKLDTMPGIHEQNSIVERRNKELLRHLRAILFHKNLKKDWSTILPLVNRIMNAERLEGLNVSPAQIIFGNSITLDRGIFLPFSPPMTEKTPDSVKVERLSDWMANMLTKQAEIISIAQKTQSETQKVHFSKYSEERTDFPIGSYVLASYGEDRPPSKLHRLWRGPYRVVKQDVHDKNRYTVQNLVTDVLIDFPNGSLKPFIEDEQGLTPMEVAMREEEYDIVEKIISHKPNKLRPNTPKGKIFFTVKYLGDKDPHPEQVPYKLLRDNEILHIYLEKNKLKSLIPAKYKWGRDGPPK